MKVLHLLSTNSYAGAENVACQIIEMINGGNIECVYCSLDGRIRETLNNKNIKFLPIKKVKEKELEETVLAEKIDLIHSHDFRATYVAHKV